jgi:hypothetical protein
MSPFREKIESHQVAKTQSIHKEIFVSITVLARHNMVAQGTQGFAKEKLKTAILRVLGATKKGCTKTVRNVKKPFEY